MEETPPHDAASPRKDGVPIISYATPGLGDNGEARPGRTVTIGRYANSMEASMRAAVLEAEGIIAKVLNANVNSLGIPYSGFTEVELQVHQDDVERATDILNTNPDDLEPVEEPADPPPVLNELGKAVPIVPAAAFDTVRKLRAAQTVLASAQVRAFPPVLVKRGDRPPGEGKRFVLQVFEEDVERAQKVLHEAEAEDEGDDDPHCPKCHSWRVHSVGRFWQIIVALTGIGKWPPRQMECLACHHRGTPGEFGET